MRLQKHRHQSQGGGYAAPGLSRLGNGLLLLRYYGPDLYVYSKGAVHVTTRIWERSIHLASLRADATAGTDVCQLDEVL